MTSSRSLPRERIARLVEPRTRTGPCRRGGDGRWRAMNSFVGGAQNAAGVKLEEATTRRSGKSANFMAFVDDPFCVDSKIQPAAAKSLGQGLREFKDSITGDSKDDDNENRPQISQTAAEASAQKLSPNPSHVKETRADRTPTRAARPTWSIPEGVR